MGVNRLLIKITNDNVEATNYQEFGMAFDSTCPLTPAQMTARMIRYFAGLNVGGLIANGCRIEEVLYRGPSDTGYTSMAWPTAELADLAEALAAAGLPAAATGTAYGETEFGSGGLAPLGTSISVSEITSHPGRSGRGRHYTPFVTADCVGPDGLAGSTRLLSAAYQYGVCFLGKTPLAPIPGVDSAIPVVSNAAGTTAYHVTLVKPQKIFSNLESRRR